MSYEGNPKVFSFTQIKVPNMAVGTFANGCGVIE